MIKSTFLVTSLLLHTLFTQAQQEARLFIPDEAKLQAIQQAILKKGTTHHEAFAQLKNRVDGKDLTVYQEGNVNRYARSYYVQEAATVSLLSADEKAKHHYAQIAFDGIKDIYENTAQERLPHKDYGLSRAMMQQALALPYAWCKFYWSKEQLDYIEAKINEALDAWYNYEHANFGDTRGSNWVAVCQGGEMVLFLAAGRKVTHPKRYAYLIEQLTLHIQNGYGSLGVSQEGIGYTEYGGAFLLKAIQATASRGDSILWDEAKKHAWWQQAMYIESFQGNHQKALMTGVTGNSAPSEGWASLLFSTVPQEELPYFTWWYDRHQGIKSVMSPKGRYDRHRAGTIWAILNYPTDVQPQDPTGNFPIAVADSHGYYFFRNRWKDENDILFSIMADEEHHGHAWDQPEVFALNLMAYNARFVGGPSKERGQDMYSTLLVDGKYNIKGATKLNGATKAWEVSVNSTKVRIDGGDLYEALGLKKAERSADVVFLADNKAVVVLEDKLLSNEEKKFTWQLNLGNDKDKGGIKVITKENSFELLGKNGKIIGWILYDDAFEFGSAEDPFQVHFSAKKVWFKVLLYLTPDKNENPPFVKVRKGKYRLGKHEFRLKK